jgi:methylenetetrahydrofolate dehydrogenase (NADP+) / methenyltetrahydrofolate cyclohydrolase
MIIDGAAIAKQIQAEIKETINQISGRKPCLAVILVGDHPPSQIYVKRKIEACKEAGIISIKRELPPAISEEHLLQEVDQLNQDPSVDGILVQLPLPMQINPMSVINRLDPKKDVDGFHPINLGKLMLGDAAGFIPCTPLGIRTLFERMNIEVEGKHALVIGRSNIVGKPMAALLVQNHPLGNATVTIAHRYSKEIKELCRMSDIVIAAIGQPRYITQDMIKKGAVVIDVGINKIPDPQKGYRLVGDVDFENVAPKCRYITPVPKGVGPMTIAMLLQNTLQAYENAL